MFVRVYVRMYVYMYTCVYLYVYVLMCMCSICVYVCMYVYMHTCVYLYVCICAYVCVYMFICINVYMSVYVCICICVYMCVCMYICEYEYVCTCVCVCAHGPFGSQGLMAGFLLIFLRQSLSLSLEFTDLTKPKPGSCDLSSYLCLTQYWMACIDCHAWLFFSAGDLSPHAFYPQNHLSSSDCPKMFLSISY